MINLMSVDAGKNKNWRDSLRKKDFSTHGSEKIDQREKQKKKTTGGGCYVLLQVSPTQGSNLRFLYLWQWQADSLPLWYMGNPELSYIHLKKCSPLNYGTTSIVGYIIMWKTQVVLFMRLSSILHPLPKYIFLPVFQMHIIWS